VDKKAFLAYGVGVLGVLSLFLVMVSPATVLAARERVTVAYTVIVDGANPERAVTVDAQGRLNTADTRMSFSDVFGSGPALKVAQQGTVQVGNLPANQKVTVTNDSLPVSGKVSVTNLPAVQPVSGTVNVAAFPQNQLFTVANDSLKVNGTVNVGNLPTTQQVTGSMAVTNLPAVQLVNGTVNVGNLPAVQDVKVTTPVTVSNLPAVQQVQGTVSVGNFPSLDVQSLVYLAAIEVDADFANPASSSLICTQGFKYTVPAGKILLITDITYTKGGPGMTALITSDKALVGRWGSGDGQTVSYSLVSPLVIQSGKTLCPAAWGSARIDLFLSGRLVDAP